MNCTPQTGNLNRHNWIIGRIWRVWTGLTAKLAPPSRWECPSFRCLPKPQHGYAAAANHRRPLNFLYYCSTHHCSTLSRSAPPLKSQIATRNFLNPYRSPHHCPTLSRSAPRPAARKGNFKFYRRGDWGKLAGQVPAPVLIRQLLEQKWYRHPVSNTMTPSTKGRAMASDNLPLEVDLPGRVRNM